MSWGQLLVRRGKVGAQSGVLSAFLLLSSMAHAENHLIGVLASRSNGAVKAAMQPTADYLSQALPGHRFTVVALDLGQMEEAVAKHTLDLVFTDPANYALLESRYRVTAIATVQGGERGAAVKENGGIIVTRVDRRDLNTLADLRGKRIGVGTEGLLDTFAAQAGVLQAQGMDAYEDSTLVKLGDKQEEVLRAVQEGRVDAGFIRAGLLESLSNGGKIRIDDFTVLNPQLLPGYPFMVSTPLYPEWPLAVAPGMPESVAKDVAVALLRMQAQNLAARAADYQGWTLPMNYQGVHTLLRNLQLPPYDQATHFKLRDVVRKYDVALIVSLLLTLLLFALAGARYVYISRSLAQRHRELQQEAKVREKAEQRLLDENQLLALLAHGVSLPLLLQEIVQSYQSEYPADGMLLMLYDPALRRYRVEVALNLGNDSAPNRYSANTIIEETSLRPALQEAAAGRPLADIPITSPSGEMLGHMMICSGDQRDKLDRDFLAGLTNIAAVAVEHSRNLERIKLDTTIVANTLEAIAIADAKGRVLDVNPAFTQLTGYSREELAWRKLELLRAARHDASFFRNLLRSLLKYGYWRGEMWSRRKDGREFPSLLSLSTVRNSKGKISQIVAAFSDISEIKDSQTRLERLANYDLLTGLPNRVLLTDRFHQAIAHTQRHKTMLGICFIDLDHFKPVNDRHGHAAGDSLLVEVAQRLRDTVRASDTVARLGGDEFVLLMCDLESPDELGSTLSRLIEKVSVPFVLENGSQVNVSASIGVTIYPNDANDPDVLLRHADQAMYRAKQEGRNCFHIFDPGQDLQVQMIVSQRQQMRDALSNNEFRLFYQPQVDMRNGALLGVEALLRWDDPARGIVLPADFLPAIEHHELIIEVGDWVLQEALRQRQEWLAGGLDLAVAVNIAPLQLMHPDFLRRLGALLRQYPTEPGKLELEILETAALGDADLVLRIIRACQRMGVNLALDDFGTGYSSLAYLRQLPVDTMKVDRSFVAGMLEDAGELAIVECILGLASAFQRNLVAEGVETIAHGTMLLRLGCHVGQGFAIARPMPGKDIPAWIAAYRPPAEWHCWRDTDATKDFLLVRAEIEHRNWVRHMKDAVAGAPIVMPKEHIADPTRSPFGRWFHQHGHKRYGASPFYQQVRAEQREVHRIGSDIMTLINVGDLAAAETLEAPLVASSERLLHALTGLQRTAARHPLQ